MLCGKAARERRFPKLSQSGQSGINGTIVTEARIRSGMTTLQYSQRGVRSAIGQLLTLHSSVISGDRTRLSAGDNMTDKKSGLAALKAFEATADDHVAGFAMLKFPARVVLAGLHYMVFTGFHARMLTGTGEPGVGETIIQRIGHALPLVRALAAKPFDPSAHDAIAAFTDAHCEGPELEELFAYLHFSDLMPEVHRGYFDVEALDDKSFSLSHASPEFAEAEAKDVTLSEIALPFALDRNSAIEPEFARMAEELPAIDWKFVAHFVAVNSYKYRHGMAEADVITDASIRRMFGFDRKTFLFIRSVILAFAEFFAKLATMMHLLIFKGDMSEDRMADALECASVCFDAEHFIGLLAAGAEATPDEVERFLELYSIDFRQSPVVAWGGDGFFPPFARFDEGLVFSPLIAMAFLQVRNAVFAFAKKDKKAFDDDVSKELEPVLLHQARELLRLGGDWIAIEDIKFPGGQVDLLVTAPDDNAVLLIQAKGNLPPQGARLTGRLSTRVREGIRQIKKFEELPEDRQRGAIEAAIGRKLGAVAVHHAVMVRSCFGDPAVYAPDFPYIRITAPLLALALEHHRANGLPTTIAALTQAIQETETCIYEEAGAYWEEGEISLAGTTIGVPLLKWRPDSLDTLRRKWWEATIRPERDGS